MPEDYGPWPVHGGSVERLIFICPVTDEEVDVGIRSDIISLLRMWHETVNALCPACKQMHKWPVREAFLCKAA
jgi:hypothetical protein